MSDLHFLPAGNPTFHLLYTYYNVRTVRAPNTGPEETKPSSLGNLGRGGEFSLHSVLFAWGTQAEGASSKARWEEVFSAVASALLQGGTGGRNVLEKVCFWYTHVLAQHWEAEQDENALMYNHPTLWRSCSFIYLPILKTFMLSSIFKFIKEKRFCLHDL